MNRKSSKLRRIILIGVFLALSSVADPASSSAEEERVCGIFGLETAMFDVWRGIANSATSAPPVDGYQYEPVSVELSDSVTLSGYRISALLENSPSRALLFLQGNAMRADQLRSELTYFVDRGFDVFIFDYRGYGKSGGTPLLKVISADQSSVINFIQGRSYDRIFLYAISIGGILALGPHMQIDAFEAIAVDSSPAKLPWYAFCPSVYNPVANLPRETSNMIVISGGLDTVIFASDVKPLGRAIEASGGEYRHEPNFGHPLMDGPQNTKFRFKIVADFFEARD